MDDIRAKLAEHRKRRLLNSTRNVPLVSSQPTVSNKHCNKFLFVIWVCFLIASYLCELFLPFLVISLLCLIYYKGTSKDSANEKGMLSAYSVFNPGCQEIQGTVNASKLQKEMMMVPS